MRLRLPLPVSGLFWKILLGFCLTVTAVSVGIWLWFSVLRGDAPHVVAIKHVVAATRGTVLRSAAVVMETGGVPAMERLQRELAGQGTVSYRLASPAGGAIAPHEVVAQSPDGQRWRIDFTPSEQERSYEGDSGPPPAVIVLYGLCGLLYSIALAWYLAAPLQRLRRAFDRFGAGDLAVRTAAGVRGRHDEIAELSRDFDAMAARIAQLMQGRERLLHDVSHELRSPLARLHVAVGLARQHPGRIDVSLDRIEREAARLNELVGGLLTLSRIEHGAIALEDRFDVRELCAAVAQDADFEGSARGVRIRMEAGDDGAEAPLRGNVELIRRAVENIVRNALHVSAQGQEVVVRFTADRARGQYVISVADQGPGVPADLLPAMFEPFVQAHANQSGGFGLGLSIAQRAVAAHGGVATAVNRTGGGLEVRIELPART